MPTPTPTPGRAGEVSRWRRRELPQFALMLALLFAARDTLANHYHVPTGSMQHTLQVGDRVFVDMRAYGARLPFTSITLVATGVPARGDIAVFDSPLDGERLIKRVAAVAGDRVELHEGRLSINGTTLATGADAVEIFGAHRAMLDLDQGGGPHIASLVVPEGQLLMLGDARGNSLDSRYFGMVPASRMYGRAIGVYYRRLDGLVWQRL